MLDKALSSSSHFTSCIDSVTHLLNTVTKLSTRELIPKTFNGGKICRGDVLHFGEIDKVTSLGFGSRKNDESIAGELDEEKRSKY